MNKQEIEEEAKALLKRYRDLRAIDRVRERMIAKYGAEDYHAIYMRFALLWLNIHSDTSTVTIDREAVPSITPEKRAELRAKKLERKNKIKEGTLVYATKKVTKKRGRVHISMPSMKRDEYRDEGENKSESAKIIYTPMGNKR